MAININSEAFCRKAYLNYHCYGNTMGISAEDMGRITQAWGDRVKSWQATVASDENEYEFDDSEYSRYIKEGKEAGKEATGGHDGKTVGQTLEACGDLAVNGTCAVTAYCGTFLGQKLTERAAEKAAEKATEKAVEAAVKAGTLKAGEKLGEEAAKKAAEEGVKNLGTKVLGEKAVDKIAEKGAEKATENTTKEVAKTFSAYVAAGFAIANAIKYWATQPNKEEKKAVDALQPEMTGAQSALGEAQTEMEAMSDEIITLSDEANYLNEDSNEEIEEQKTEYDMYMQTFLSLQEKVEAGEPLTDSEKELYKEVVGYLGEISGIINEISEDTTDEVSDLYDEIATYQEGYDYTAETMGEIEGLTDYAESFDKTTQTMCYVECGAQTLNIATATKAAARLFAGPWWNWAIAILASAAGASSAIAAGQQFKWASDVGVEIEMRKTAQDLNAETMDIYSEEVDAYDGYMQGVEDLELEIPDEIAPPEVEGVPAEGEDPNGIESSEYTNYTEVLQEMDEGSKVVTENKDGTGKVVIAAQYGNAIATAIGLPDNKSGGKFGKESIPAIIAQLVPGYTPEEILKVMNGGTIETSYQASLFETTTGEDTGKNTTINNTEKSTENLKAIINFYNPIFLRASLQGWKC